jgi:methylphosphotriester-DNA--protein-cysteine methyltransferase
MTDIVQRLRSGEVCINNPCRMMDARSGCTCAEAADAIERLRDDLAETNRQFAQAVETGTAAVAEIERLRAEMERLRQENEALRMINTPAGYQEMSHALNAEIERLRRELAHEHKLWAALKEKADA